jgi:zeta-carotene desaturase
MVLLRTLLGRNGDRRLYIPKTPLSELIDRRARCRLESKGCEVRLSTKVERVNIREGRARSVSTKAGDVSADHFVCAVPPWSLNAMGLVDDAWRRIVWRPIVSAHLFLEGQPLDFDRACIVGQPFGWVFDKSRDFGLPFAYVQAVASAAGALDRLGQDEITDMALIAALKAAPECEGVRLRKAIVVRERRATFSTCASSESARPGCATPLPNLFVAGDWTDTGWPSTMESAVRSGMAAASAVLRRT